MMTSQIFFSPLPFPQSSVFCLDLGLIVKTHRQYTISKSGLMQLYDNIWFSILAMKIFAKATAIFVPMAVLWVFRWLLLQNWNEFSVYTGRAFLLGAWWV